jgi:hypothetical protein
MINDGLIPSGSGGDGANTYFSGGGGGGMSSVGGSGDVPDIGFGGDGITFVWDTTYSVCGGGCGNGQSKTNSYGGGSSGVFNSAGGNGVDYTGGGGGGTSMINDGLIPSGSGGDGFVILRYPI